MPKQNLRETEVAGSNLRKREGSTVSATLEPILEKINREWWHQLLRGLAKVAIAMTGFGLFYLLAKTKTVKEGEVVVTWKYDKLEILGPGMHTLLNPFHSFEGEPIKITNKTFQLGTYQVVTVDDGEVALSLRNGKWEILEPGRHILNSKDESHTVKKCGSSAKSVGGWRLFKPSKLVIECYLQAVQCFKA